jgi:hypothetical protein
MIGKWVELLKEIAPSTRRIAVIFNPETAPRGRMSPFGPGRVKTPIDAMIPWLNRRGK